MKKNKKKKENYLINDSKNSYITPYSVKLFSTLALIMGVPYITIVSIIECF